MDRAVKKAVYDPDLHLEAYRFKGVVQPFPSHFHDYYVIGLVERGERNMICRGKEYLIGAGDILVFHPGDSHSCVQSGGETMDYRGMNLSKPVMAVIMIYTIVGTWNAWFGASIYTTNRDIQPVQLYMRHVLAATSTSMQSQMLEQLPEELRLAYQKKALAANQIKYALIVLTTLTIIAVYPMFQKHFTKGIMLGSLKG